MFGYIRPMQGELRVYELERFKACYCGLCHALGKKYGLAARFLLNYELVFLTMILWGRDETPSLTRKRCIAAPFKRKRCCARNTALDKCAAYNVILARWKLLDTISDESAIKAFPHRLALLLISRSYKKAALEFPEFDGAVREEVSGLAEYEAMDGSSLDGAADKFANMLCAAVPKDAPQQVVRPLREMLYHLGRWIYIIDACDDVSEDLKSKRYNPIKARYRSEFDGIPNEALEKLRITLTHSNNLLCLAFELLPENYWSEIIRNMIYQGMPYACGRVLKGQWPPQKEKEWN